MNQPLPAPGLKSTPFDVLDRLLLFFVKVYSVPFSSSKLDSVPTLLPTVNATWLMACRHVSAFEVKFVTVTSIWLGADDLEVGLGDRRLVLDEVVDHVGPARPAPRPEGDQSRQRRRHPGFPIPCPHAVSRWIFYLCMHEQCHVGLVARINVTLAGGRFNT